MAQDAVVLDQDQFNCSICKEVLRDPVTTPCGHNYCSVCLQDYWVHGDRLGLFMCPQCRERFSPRAPLARSNQLADAVDKFRAAAAAQCQSFAEADGVECDVCTGRKNKAVRACLVCLVSYCYLHVKPHYESAAFHKHKLVPASKKLHEVICPRHHRLLELYCRTDNRCICSMCPMDEHEGHDAAIAEEEVQRRQQLSRLRVQAREKEAQQLGQAIHSVTCSAREAAAESHAVFTELMRSIESRRFQVRGLIEDQEKMAVGQARKLLEKVQKEISEMKKSQAEMDKLSHTNGPFHFLQSTASLHAPPELSALPAVTFGPVMTAVTDLKRLAEEAFRSGFVGIAERVRDVRIVSSSTALARIDTGPSGEAGVKMEPAAVTPMTGPPQAPKHFQLTFPTFSFGLPAVRDVGVASSSTALAQIDAGHSGDAGSNTQMEPAPATPMTRSHPAPRHFLKRKYTGGTFGFGFNYMNE